jgi:hypothetical protein
MVRGCFSASGHLHHTLNVLDGGRRLSARGIPVDTITFLAPQMASSDDPVTPDVESVLHWAAGLCHYLQRDATATGSHAADTYHFNNEPWHDVMWRTCCMDCQIFPVRRASLDNRPAFEACLERYGFGAEALATVALDEGTERAPMKGMVVSDNTPLAEAARGFEFGVLLFQRERIFGITGKQGFIGSFPKETRAGDVVVVLLGGELPVVLRPLDGAETGFELVGTCYVHGIMDGEWITHATDGQEDGSEVFQDFVIY